jgi:ClpP class serine protease
MGPLDLLWLFFIFSTFQPLVQQKVLAYQRGYALRQLEKRDGSRVITMIHRREGCAFFGIPFGGYIDIDDSEAVIRAIEMTGRDVPISLVLHTPGGLVLAAEQIAAALAGHAGPVKVYVPHYAMSGGTLIALAADQSKGRRPSVEYVPAPYDMPPRTLPAHGQLDRRNVR